MSLSGNTTAHATAGNAIDSNDELIRLVTSNADVTSQYVIFRNGYDELYAINVAKVEELIVNKELRIARNHESNQVLLGVAKIRENMCSIVHFDRWLGKGEAPDCDYELIIVCNFGHQRVGIIIKNVIGILNIEAEKLTDNSARDPKSSQITEIALGGKSSLCVVFNSDMLLNDVFPDGHAREISKIDALPKLAVKGKVLFCDDSKIIQKAVEKALDQMGLEHETFDNGDELLRRVQELGADKVALIISDIEMPVMDGMTLLREVKSDMNLFDIPFIMNTNMANPSLVDQAMRQGVDHVIHKLDVADLHRQVQKYARA